MAQRRLHEAQSAGNLPPDELADNNAMIEQLKKEVDAALALYNAEQTKAEEEQEQYKEMVKAEDLALELRQNELQQELTLLKQLKDAHKELFKTASQEFKPSFTG